jgi:hypothetical protein
MSFQMTIIKIKKLIIFYIKCLIQYYAIHQRLVGNENIHDCSRSGRSKSTRLDENIKAVSEIMSRNSTKHILTMYIDFV